jgi:hypothetical protein
MSTRPKGLLLKSIRQSRKMTGPRLRFGLGAGNFHEHTKCGGVVETPDGNHPSEAHKEGKVYCCRCGMYVPRSETRIQRG